MAKRPWGEYQHLEGEIQIDHASTDHTYWVKAIRIDPGQSISLQSHEDRDETWVVIRGHPTARLIDWPKTLKNGDIYIMGPGMALRVPRGTRHRLSNPGDGATLLIEVAIGDPREEDITRYEDQYGRK